MNKDNLMFSTSNFEISEENDLYLTLVNMLCYYDESNLNDVMLPYSGYEEKAVECANSLINMPVQAKLKKSVFGNKTDFGDHEMYIDKDGNVCFDTVSIGVHEKVWIDFADVNVKGEIRNMPVLYAQSRIWKRYKNVVDTIKRLYSAGELSSSWELVQSKSFVDSQGRKVLEDYKFTANTLLGSKVCPAYTNAKVLMVASENEDEIATALSLDISECLNKEDNKEEEVLDCELKSNVSEINDSTDNNVDDVEKNCEESKCGDEKDKKSEAEKVKEDNTTDKENDDTKTIEKNNSDNNSEVDTEKVEEEENKDDEDSEKNKISELEEELFIANKKISELSKEIEDKNDLLVKANELIQSKDVIISELSIYKEKFEEYEKQKMIAEKEEKKQALKDRALASKVISEKELKSDEFVGYIDNLDKAAIDSIIAERVINGGFITSSNNKQEREQFASANLSNDDAIELDAKGLMSIFLNNKK